MQLAAIERRTTVDLVVDRIVRVIKDQKLAAGSRLPGEHELVEQLQVSRPVLREALARLQSLGLVDIQRGRGTFVGDTNSLANCVRLLQSAVTISPQELLSYAELRSAIEVQAARQAAEKATAKDIELLSALLNQLEVIYEFVLTQMVRTTPTQRENQLGRKLHKAVLKAVRDHDPDAAELAMRKHMQAVLDRLKSQEFTNAK